MKRFAISCGDDTDQRSDVDHQHDPRLGFSCRNLFPLDRPGCVSGLGVSFLCGARSLKRLGKGGLLRAVQSKALLVVPRCSDSGNGGPLGLNRLSYPDGQQRYSPFGCVVLSEQIAGRQIDNAL